MVQATLQINKASIDRKIEEAEEILKEKLRRSIEDKAEHIIAWSPVDTGAYVTSHSVKANNTSSRGRSKSSRGKPRNQSHEVKKQEGLSNLLGDIQSIFSAPISNLKKITFRNDSPHSQVVEHGGPNWNKPGYKVYTKLRNLF